MVAEMCVKLVSPAGKVPKLDEDLRVKINQLPNPTINEVARAIEEYRTNKIRKTQITLKEDEIYRFTI